jgi:hypothetical protein
MSDGQFSPRWTAEHTDEVRSKSYERAHMDAITKDHRKQ